jgi:ABC-type glycerol-3-phosphate transport system substrate-binding protein
MKLAKFGIFALALGLFTASCGGDTTEEGTTEDTSMNTMMEPATPVTPDTMMAAPATTDTTMMNGGAAADTTKK